MHFAMRRLLYFVSYLITVNIRFSSQCPQKSNMADTKISKIHFTNSSTEIKDLPPTSPMTLEKIKAKLKESGILDWEDQMLSKSETEELNQLFDTLEIMMTSRNRQPSNVQNTFATLRMVEKVVRKQLKQGRMSQALANKFKWHKLSLRRKREKPLYWFDEKNRMRVFYVDN